MKLTITIEEEKEGQVQIEQRPGGATLTSTEERSTEPAATDAGGPPQWLLAELEGAPQAPGVETPGEALDAGPAPPSTNGMASLPA